MLQTVGFDCISMGFCLDPVPFESCKAQEKLMVHRGTKTLWEV